MAKKENQQPDNHVGEVVSRSEQFIEKNMTKIGLVILGVFIIVAGIFAYKRFVSEPKAREAAAKVYLAEDKFIQELDSAALNGNGANEMGLLAVIKKYSGSDASNLAKAYAGICYYNLGEYQKAIDHLKGFSSKENMVAPSITRLIGDCYVQLKKYEEAVQFYKEALRNNPTDEQTRYNLAIAKEKLKKQQQENKNNQNNQNNQQNKDNKDNKDNQNKDNKDNKDNQNKDNKDNKDNQNKDNKDNKDNQNKDNKDNKDNKNQGSPERDKQENNNQDNRESNTPEEGERKELSAEQMNRILNAINNEEKKTQEKLNANKVKGKAKKSNTKDW